MMQLLMLSSVMLLAAGVTGETCPGGQVRCPDFMTCCQLKGKDEFGCCPFPEAKCCADHVHCCPHSMDCDIAHQACIRNGSAVQIQWQIPINAELAEPVSQKSSLEVEKERNGIHRVSGASRETNVCPDDSPCHNSFTCCKMYSGAYGCCPFSNGTCCTDGFHCCPSGSKCSRTGSCISTEMSYEVNAHPLKNKKYEEALMTQKLEKLPHQEVSDPGGLCPDGHPCPEKYTCCRINGKRYGCCPYKEAVCCDDGIHCCPKGTTCNTTLGTCDVQRTFQWTFPSQPLEALQWSESAKTEESKVHTGDVVCPDEHYHCPSRTTCCELQDGSYGCCPMERATCCEDKEHCCPNGFQCTVGGCVKGTKRLPPFLWNARAEKTNSFVKDHKTAVKANETSVICPDHYPCPDGNTCCQLASGDYGCCPMEKATCCADKLHCCPHGYRCVRDGCRKESEDFQYPITVDSTKLQRDFEVKAMETGTEPIIMPEEGLQDICPDKKSECPDGATCCEVAEGGYGCCAYEDATCCGDEVHCCPHGYWCTDEGCDRMPGAAEHYAPFILKLFRSKGITKL